MREEFLLKNDETVVIRQIKAADYDVIMDFLEEMSLQDTFTNQYPGQPKKDRESSIKQYENPNNLFLMVELANNKVVGVSNISIAKPNHPIVGRNAGFGISILSSHQGVGLGTKLMQMMEDWARERNMHRIEGKVRTYNPKAISLYLKQGFYIEGRHLEASFIEGKWCDEYSIAKILE